MCRALNISRGMIYYTPKENKVNTELESEVIAIHKASRNHYGTRKIKRKLAKKGYQVSRRRIGKIMKKYDLVSTYTKKQTENLIKKKL
jgi:SOS response regulatory protein OraA/RecX